MKRVKAKTYRVFLYGHEYKCSVEVSKGQVWRVEYVPSESCPVYGLSRKGITIQITKEQLDRNFSVIWE